MTASGISGLGTLVSGVFLLNLVFQPLQELSDVYGQLQSGAAAMVKIATVLDEQPEIRDRRNPHELPRIEGDLAVSPDEAADERPWSSARRLLLDWRRFGDKPVPDPEPVPG